jgi:hypothetical protein
MRVAPPGLLRQRDGALRQAFEDEIVEPAALRELDRGLDPVARITRAGADPDLSQASSRVRENASTNS